MKTNFKEDKQFGLNGLEFGDVIIYKNKLDEIGSAMLVEGFDKKYNLLNLGINHLWLFGEDTKGEAVNAIVQLFKKLDYTFVRIIKSENLTVTEEK